MKVTQEIGQLILWVYFTLNDFQIHKENVNLISIKIAIHISEYFLIDFISYIFSLAMVHGSRDVQ